MSDKFTPEFSRIVKTEEMVSGKEKLVVEANEKSAPPLLNGSSWCPSIAFGPNLKSRQRQMAKSQYVAR